MRERENEEGERKRMGKEGGVRERKKAGHVIHIKVY